MSLEMNQQSLNLLVTEFSECVTLSEFQNKCDYFVNSINDPNLLNNELINAIKTRNDFLFLKLAIYYHKKHYHELALFCCENGGNKGMYDAYREQKNAIKKSIGERSSVRLDNENIYLYEYKNDKNEIIYYHNDEGDQVSMTLVKCQEQCLIIDCGSYIDHLGNEQFIDIDAFLNKHHIKREQVVGVLVTHAHLDHYGSLDLLYQYFGKRIKIYTSGVTARLLKLVSRLQVIEALYTFDYNKPFYVGDFKIVPYSCGHIPGASSFKIETLDHVIFYTGDYTLDHCLGNKGLDLSSLNDIETLVIESTYGDQDEPHFDPHSIQVIFSHILIGCIKTSTTLLMPSRSIGNTQKLLQMLEQLGIRLKVLLSGNLREISQYYFRNLDLQIDNLRLEFVNSDLTKEQYLNYDVIIASSSMLQIGSPAYKIAKMMLLDHHCILFKNGYIKKGNVMLRDYERLGALIDLPMSHHACYHDLVHTIKKVKPKQVVAIHGNGIKR